MSNMAARRRRVQADCCLRSLDCVGILKLRNADIELRKGDLGRRNTRVRVGYRVHVPQLHGNVLCLQTASVPIECCESPASIMSPSEPRAHGRCSALLYYYTRLSKGDLMY